jgi:hypothetical protein
LGVAATNSASVVDWAIEDYFLRRPVNKRRSMKKYQKCSFGQSYNPQNQHRKKATRSNEEE